MKKDNFDLRAALREKTEDFMRKACKFGLNGSLAILDMEVRAITQVDPAAFDEEIRAAITTQTRFVIDDLDALGRDLQDFSTTKSALAALLDRLGDLKDRINREAWHACKQAAFEGDDARLRLLMAGGYGISKRDALGETLLEKVLFHHPTMPVQKKLLAVQTLLRHGADIQEGLQHGLDPIIRAVLEAEMLRRAAKDAPPIAPRIARRGV